MWTEMPKLGWMSSSQTQTISKFPSKFTHHVRVEEFTKLQGTSQCGAEGATSACQGSEFDVFLCVLCLCFYAFLTCHHIKRQGLAAQLTSAAWWQTSNWYDSGVMKLIVCALMKLHNLARVQWFCCFFPHLFTRQHTCCQYMLVYNNTLYND